MCVHQVFNSYELIAYALISGNEDTANWHWFLSCVLDAYEIHLDVFPSLVLISDRDKGLSSTAVRNMLSERLKQLWHLWCVLHIVGNVIRHCSDRYTHTHAAHAPIQTYTCTCTYTCTYTYSHIEE